MAIKEIYPKTDSNVRLKQHSLQPEYAEKAMKIVINVIPEAFIGNPVSLKGAGNHLDSRSLLKTCWDKLCGNDGFDLMP
ncbi:MAG: hypothetical protein A2X87_00445 [Deltaproteobacteria bacterium GWC2_42_51]|nr:MAG: hypothetical protein A2X87_00445 [Deltaproteobacteria bacterium GWC2_42_51]